MRLNITFGAPDDKSRVILNLRRFMSEPIVTQMKQIISYTITSLAVITIYIKFDLFMRTGKYGSNAQTTTIKL